MLDKSKPVSALEYCKWLRDKGACPHIDDQGRHPVSNSQLKRWLDNRSIIINGVKPTAWEEIKFPV